MTALTPQVEAAILESVRQGTPISAAFEAAGVTRTTLSRWRAIAEGAEKWPGSTADAQVSPEYRDRIVAFVRAIADARASTVRVLTSSLYHNATTANEKTGWYDTQAADKLLSKNPDHHDDWWERKQMDVNSTTTVTIERELVKAASPAELDAWESELERLALPPGD